MRTPLRRLICLLLSLLLLLFQSISLAEDTIVEPTYPPDAPKYSSEHPEELEDDMLLAASAILVEANTGMVIYEKNADAIMFPASTTKILTVLLGIQMADDLDAQITISPTAMDIPEDSSTMNLSEGEIINYTDLLYGTMMLSANEGANAIAETISGDIGSFVDLMNSAVSAYGCTNTHFANPHGYHDDNHYTTARDLSIIAREAMKNDLFRDIVAAVTYTIPRTNIHRAHDITTRSRILREPTESSTNSYYYEYATGIKTGSHSKAGYCFVGSAEKDGVSLISVVLYTSNYGRWTDTKKLFEYGFSQYISVTPVDLFNMNPISVQLSSYSTSDSAMGNLQLGCVPAGPNISITSTYDQVDYMADNLQTYMLVEYTRDFTAPVTAGEVMGTMTYFDDYGNAYVYNLVATRSVQVRSNIPPTAAEIEQALYASGEFLPPLTLEMVLSLLIIFGIPLHLIR